MNHAQTITTFIVLSFLPYCQQMCPNTWFGPTCSYRCHCVGKCGWSGECPGDKCIAGWFGLRCQNRDWLNETKRITTVPTQLNPDLPWLKDTDNTTCNTNPSLLSVTLEWENTFVFTWLRYIIKDNVDVPNLRVFGYGWNGKAEFNVTCVNTELKTINKRTYELECEASHPIKKLLVSGENVRTLCVLNINAGRNVALNQKVTISSSWARPDGPNAVDDNLSSRYEDGSCTHTGDDDELPTLIVEYERSYLITKYVLYNREAPLGIRLKAFTLTSFDASGKEVFTFQDMHDGDEGLESYHVVSPLGHKQPVKSVRITQNRAYLNEEAILTICELQTFGDCEFGTWNLECENCSANCHGDTCLRDSGLCHQGCKGFSNPPVCTEPCKPGVWGLNCTVPCHSKNCFNNTCNKDTGFCDQGCLPRYMDNPNCSIACFEHCVENVCDVISLECTKGCQTGWFGIQCNNECPEQCKDKICNSSSGLCLSCEAAYYGLKCDRECPTECNNDVCDQVAGLCTQGCKDGFYGEKCTINCPVRCPENLCSPTDGQCTKGCHRGQYGFQCQNDCSSACKDAVCDSDTGNCTEGCVPGWFRSLCNETCPGKCTDDVCIFDTGLCPEGCTSGFYGASCSGECSPNCAGKVCDTDGKCTKGCKQSYTGTRCNKVAPEEKSGSGLFLVLLALLIVVSCVAAMAVLARKSKMAVEMQGPMAEAEPQATGIEIQEPVAEADQQGTG